MAATMPVASPRGNRTPNAKGPTSPPNVTNVVLGKLHIKPWYPSFYPEDMIGGKRTDWLYVCEYCFKYTGEVMKYSAHSKVCPMKDETPPGDTVYETDEYIIRQFDGEEHKLYAQNLSLFAKLFLDTKSVFFDVNTFLYYTLIKRPTSPKEPGQVVGFFSKEKMSWDNNNLACILVFPPWQKRGLGQMLIATSYGLGRKEGRFGGPEKPLSSLGRKGYIQYWSGEICRFILGGASKRTVTMDAMSEGTYIMKEDLVAALKEMDVLENRKTPSGSVVINKTKVKTWAEAKGVSMKPLIDVDALIWYEEGSDDDDENEDESMEE